MLERRTARSRSSTGHCGWSNRLGAYPLFRREALGGESAPAPPARFPGAIDILAAFFSGLLRLDVHGFGITTFAQSFAG